MLALVQTWNVITHYKKKNTNEKRIKNNQRETSFKKGSRNADETV